MGDAEETKLMAHVRRRSRWVARNVDNDLEKMRVNEYAGIEYYPGGSTIPTQYNRTGSSCGVLLFWTRER